MNATIKSPYPAILLGVTHIVAGAIEQVGLKEYERGLAEGKEGGAIEEHNRLVGNRVSEYAAGYEEGATVQNQSNELNIERRVRERVATELAKVPLTGNQYANFKAALAEAIDRMEGTPNRYKAGSPRADSWERARRDLIAAVRS